MALQYVSSPKCIFLNGALVYIVTEMYIPKWLCSMYCHLNVYFYRTQVNLGSDLWVRMSLTPRPLWNLTELTLADNDTNPILTDNANRAIQGNVATQPGGQLCKQCKWRHLMIKCWTNPCCATWWPNMQFIYKWHHLVTKFATNACGAIWWSNF